MAGFVGVAATGVVIARAERKRRAYTPDEIHARLRERYAEVDAATEPGDRPDRSAAKSADRGRPLPS